MTDHTVQLEFNRAKFRFSLRHNNMMYTIEIGRNKYGGCGGCGGGNGGYNNNGLEREMQTHKFHLMTCIFLRWVYIAYY